MKTIEYKLKKLDCNEQLQTPVNIIHRSLDSEKRIIN